MQIFDGHGTVKTDAQLCSDLLLDLFQNKQPGSQADNQGQHSEQEKNVAESFFHQDALYATPLN